MTNGTYTLVTKPSCPNCPIARRYLQINKIDFEELSLDTPEIIAAFKEQYPSVSSVPAIIKPDGSLYLAWKTA